MLTMTSEHFPAARKVQNSRLSGTANSFELGVGEDGTTQQRSQRHFLLVAS